MKTGTVLSLHITPAAGGDMISTGEVNAVPGKGLEGDRYFSFAGTFSKKPGPDREVTLIEVEALDALGRDYKVEIKPGEARRNIVTTGVALNHLVGKRFRVGSVVFRGIRLCEPCAHLAKFTGETVIRGLVHRGGLRAQVLSEGTIRVGDAVAVVAE
jgi:MOSC domain-containing protein YiiM